jgi:hypothetical protein
MRAWHLAVTACSVFVLVLGGCASESGDMTRSFIVPVDLAALAPGDISAAQRAEVKVTDIRHEGSFERTSLGVSMGGFTLDPPEAEIIRAMVAQRADLLLSKQAVPGSVPVVVLCGIRVFDISTTSTLLYWDVASRIELVLRVGGRDRVVSGAATERTYLWPGQDMIGSVTQAGLHNVGVEIDAALADLLATPLH